MQQSMHISHPLADWELPIKSTVIHLIYSDVVPLMTSFPIASVTKLSTEIYQKDKKQKMSLSSSAYQRLLFSSIYVIITHTNDTNDNALLSLRYSQQ